MTKKDLQQFTKKELIEYISNLKEVQNTAMNDLYDIKINSNLKQIQSIDYEIKSLLQEADNYYLDYGMLSSKYERNKNEVLSEVNELKEMQIILKTQNEFLNALKTY